MRGLRVWAIIAVGAVGACGRVRFDPRGLATDAPLLSLDAGECPPAYVAAGGSCYRAEGNVTTWLDAELSCEADGVGAHLATVDDAAEAMLLATMLPEFDYWIGLSDRVTEGSYRNVTGELATYLTWRVGEPTSADCGQVDDLAELHVSSCSSTDNYVCEYDGRPAVAGAY